MSEESKVTPDAGDRAADALCEGLARALYVTVTHGHREDRIRAWDESTIPKSTKRGWRKHADALLSVSDLPALLIAERVRICNKAHDVFCPRGPACSTHLRPGDRHLLVELALDEEADDV